MASQFDVVVVGSCMIDLVRLVVQTAAVKALDSFIFSGFDTPPFILPAMYPTSLDREKRFTALPSVRDLEAKVLTSV